LPETPYIVMCMKWGTLYGPDYVNVLYSATRKYLRAPFRFVCLTDRAEGIRDAVECYPIPDPGIGQEYYGRGGWPKLLVHAAELYGLQGRALFIDLDSIIVGELEPMLQAEGGIIVIREWRRFADYFRKYQVNGATGVFAWTIGGQAQIQQGFLADPAGVRGRYRSEQRYVTDHARDMQFWPHPDVISFKRHLMAPALLDRFLPVKKPWPGVRIVAFHGSPRPIDVVPDKGQNWGKGLRHGRGSVPFVRDYWLEHGGREP
jgi:hypothetical protein